MMATSMGPNFTGGHPAGMTHPGVANHGMGPGMPHNPGQQGVPGGGMPHQFAGGPMAVQAPGGQVNPAMMGGMPQGANPHAHGGLQHLNPQQQQQLLQQQQQFQNFQHNPNAMAAMRQHQHLMQHQQARQLMQQQAQQAYNNNLQAGGVPMGMQLNPQQIHQLRQAGRLAPGQHPQQAQALVAQQYALHQQQQAQQQAQQQQQQAQQQAQQQQGQPGSQQPPQGQPQAGQNAGQPGQMNAQAMQNAAQQGQTAGSAPNQMGGPQAQQGPQGQPGQQGQQGQPGGQPARTQTPSQAQNQPQQPGQQQQTPQQTSQAGTPAASQQTPGQTPGSTTAAAQQGQQPSQGQQQQQPQGQPQPQPQSQAHAQQQQAQASQPQLQQGQPQQNQQLQLQQQMGHPNIAAQQYAFQNSVLQQQRQRDNMKGQCLLKLMQFSEHLSGFPGPKGKDDLSYWNAFVERFFAPEGVFRHSLHITDSGEPTDKQYEIAFPAIARYFHTHFGSGVRNMQLILDKGTTDRPLPHECHFIENSKASLVYWFETGSHLVANGTLRAQFNAQQRIELLEFITTSHEEYISRKQVIDAAKPAHQWIKEWRNVNSDVKQSPELSKKGKGKQLKSPQSHPPEILDLPDSAVNSKGVTAAVHQFLEIVEVMGQMNPLFGYYHANPGMGPYAALEQYVSTNINQGPAMNGQPGQQNPRTPSFNQFQMGASPAAAHMNLPGSPHVGGSPAPGQMQAPAMQLQQSQQGTSSSGPSANTSPASNKRRRPSGVKTEDDGSAAPTPQVNGIQNRPGKPATPRMNKRAKTNQS